MIYKSEFEASEAQGKDGFDLMLFSIPFGNLPDTAFAWTLLKGESTVSQKYPSRMPKQYLKYWRLRETYNVFYLYAKLVWPDGVYAEGFDLRVTVISFTECPYRGP